MWQYIEESYQEMLQCNGLREFSDFMTVQRGVIVKKLQSRTVLKIEIPYRREIKTFFLKRHKSSWNLGEIIRAWLSGFPLSWGRKEWAVIKAFQEIGIPTLRPVAAGERLSWFWQESFLMTEELSGFQSLEAFLQKHFTTPLTREMIAEKRAMIKELSQICRVMHQSGFNHRDFYCCHIFIKLLEDGQRNWRVLDLQRVDRRRWFRKRWIIKDLSALNYSSPASKITRNDRLRFLKYYMNTGESLQPDRAFIRSIDLKTRRIMYHDIKLKMRKSVNGLIKVE